jgi:hypothetical protein
MLTKAKIVRQNFIRQLPVSKSGTIASHEQDMQLTRWSQWVDATLARSLSEGISKAKFVRERRFKEKAALLRLNRIQLNRVTVFKIYPLLKFEKARSQLPQPLDEFFPDTNIQESFHPKPGLYM